MRRRIFTFIFFASLFKAGNLPVLELDGALQLPPIPVLLIQSVDQLCVGGKGVLKTGKASYKSIAIKPLSRLKIFFIRQVLGAGAMVTYLQLRFYSVKQLIELVDVVVVPLAESLHDLAWVLVGRRGAEPPCTTPPANQGIISRSFSLVN